MSNIDKIALETPVGFSQDDIIQGKHKTFKEFKSKLSERKVSASLKHFPESLLQEVKRLKLLDEEEELLYTKRGHPEDWVWDNEGLLYGGSL